MQVPVIETSRLRLRGWTQGYAQPLAELNANADFIKYLGEGKPITAQQS